MIDINVNLFQWFINFFHQKASGGVVKSEIMPNQQSVKELHNPVIRIFGFLI